MSHKKAKLMRKQLKQSMENRNGSTQQVQYSFQQLENFIALCQLLTGQKPQAIALTESYYNWYIQETQRHAETLGLNPGFKGDEPVFLGVKLTKKVNIVTPTKDETKVITK